MWCHRHGRPQKIFQGGEGALTSTFCLSFSGCCACDQKRTPFHTQVKTMPEHRISCNVISPPWASAEIFPAAQHWRQHFAYPLQVAMQKDVRNIPGYATCMDVHKTLYPFHITIITRHVNHELQHCSALAAIATYFTIIDAIGCLQIFKGVFLWCLTKQRSLPLFYLAILVSVTWK